MKEQRKNERELYEIYERNFSFNIREKETVKNILNKEDNVVIEKRNISNNLIGVSVLNKNTILMLCVDKEYRNQGIGTKLLKESEQLILEKGYKKVRIGEGFDYLMPGVPLVNNNENFFTKRGYIHSWGEDECFDMDMELYEINYKENVGDIINGIEYTFATISDLEEIKKCVNDAESKFTQYYLNEKLYMPKNNQRVLIAKKNLEVCGAIIISIETEAKNIGSVGCTATKTNFRHQKIATHLVKIGTKYLKDIGMKYGHLGYTYTGLDKLYGYAGYRITTKYMMAEKQLFIE